MASAKLPSGLGLEGWSRKGRARLGDVGLSRLLHVLSRLKGMGLVKG